MSESSAVLTQATNEWSIRPADERFSSLAALHKANQDYRELAREAVVPYADLRVQADASGGLVLTGKKEIPLAFTHWSFGQLCQRSGSEGVKAAPSEYLRSLSPTLAAQCLNYNLARKGGEDRANLLLHKNGGFRVDAFLTERYTRIWNDEISSRLIQLTQEQPEWQPAPAAFDGSRGLYASAHDMFAFLVDNDRRIFEKGPGGGLGRGFFVSNSQVGAASFKVTRFFYEYVCGNHRVWGASGVTELSIRHIGKADSRAFGELQVELRRFADSSAAEDEQVIARAQKVVLGKDREEVLDKVFGLKQVGLSRGLIGQGYDRAEQHEDWYGSPRTVWGLAGGLTEVARDMEFTDRRVDVERATGKLMQVEI